MASTYTAAMRLEKMAKGDQNGTWGGTLNAQYELIEAAIGGFVAIAHDDSPNLVLTALDGVADQARAATVKITGALTGNRNIVVPNVAKHYVVHNATTGGFNVTIKTSAGAGVAVPPGLVAFVYFDGANNTQMIGSLADMRGSNNLSELTNVATARATLGINQGLDLPGNNADTCFAEGTYRTGSTWTGSPFVGSNGGNQGYLRVRPWNTNSYVIQEFTSVNSTFLKFERRRDDGVWGAWMPMPTGKETTSTLGPSGGADGDKWYQVPA